MREIVRGVEVGGGGKREFIVYNYVSTSVIANSSHYAILSKEMETFDWLAQCHRVLNNLSAYMTYTYHTIIL